MKFLFYTALLMLCGSPAQSQAADTSSGIKSAPDYYDAAWKAGDPELIRNYYHPDFVLITPSRTRTLGHAPPGR